MQPMSADVKGGIAVLLLVVSALALLSALSMPLGP